eukprot:TRINITY_DN5793_c0_g1_i2.p1 TRINITY_DN5793_c0_g1~~TRINITY_DN5793_c0_g1_i2.p1  ORF type:complete len:376 (-),score=42.84 TRINITY_DN5793_c0_g1_i2:574-1701(-)
MNPSLLGQDAISKKPLHFASTTNKATSASSLTAPSDAKLIGMMATERKMVALVGLVPAIERLRNHYTTFVTRADFKFLAQHGVNAVRIPVGWWVARGAASVAEWDLVQMYVQRLDEAFGYAEEFKMGVWLVLQAIPKLKAPGAVEEEAGKPKGFYDGEWAAEGLEHLHILLEAVEYLTQRYASRPSFLGISLLGEKLAERFPAEILTAYYLAGYAAVRATSPCAFVGISIAHKEGILSGIPSDFLDESSFPNLVVDMNSFFPALTLNDTRDGVSNLTYIFSPSTVSIFEKIGRVKQGETHHVVIGEWSMAFDGAELANDKVLKQFGKAQLQAYEAAQGGWFFWSHRMERSDWPHWSFQESIKKGWLHEKGQKHWA